ncbi:hypothetical protein [Pontibacter harenae]|uniref:hypothetical protein n=1 Tax=Pontibacter harenae TaxID=2894083 RepID=UPI001E3FC261|nr:hypothetical protein [Pontibacter harenae]MCC9168366.1 hypothetical protein [Pontibacter harenae]
MKQLLPLLFFFTTLTAQAQTKFSEEPESFIAEAKAMLVSGRVDKAEAVGTALEEAWNSGKLSSKHKKEIITISQRMSGKRLRPQPYFGLFYTLVTAGVNNQNVSGQELGSLLGVVSKSVEKDDAKQFAQFLSTASTYLSTNLLQQTPYYSLRSTGGKISFAYEERKGGAAEPQDNSNWDNISWDDEVGVEQEIDPVWGVPITKAKPKKETKEDREKAEKRRKEELKKQFIPNQPAVAGPVLKLENATLNFVTPWDSSSIQGTSGYIMLASNMFVGEGGTFQWKIRGAPASAEFRKYNFDITTASFKVPDATVTYNAVLGAPVDGAFEWLSTKRKPTDNYPYPRFISFTNDARITTYGDNIVYKGGLLLLGNKIGSKCLDNRPAEIIVFQNGERKFRAASPSYTITDSLITTTRASIAIYQQQDSLTHPAVQLRYYEPNQELTLLKDDGAFAQAPFFDSYHKLEVTAERLQWNLNESNINFSVLTSKSIVPVQVESTNYYSSNRFAQLIGGATFHPLLVFVNHAKKVGSGEFFVNEVTKSTGLKEGQVRDAANMLSRQSFLQYDAKRGFIQLNQKAWHYAEASQKLSDYDHLIIKSVVPSGRNATLNLDENKLTVRGVDKITFNNDTASVYIIPRRREVHILKNRDMEFDGQVYASSLAFKGSEFKFNYDEFSIDLVKLDSIALVSRRKRAVGGEATDQVLSGKGSKMSGKLYINKPNNKSGKEHFPEYPKFDAPVGGQVAFSRPDVLGGAYDSTVFFEMPPFQMDSLGTGKGAVAFDGTFQSGGIFPPIKVKLTMMPDESLGFYYQPSAEGLPAFGGKAMVYDTIMMNSDGIQSKGRIKYLAATLEAPSFTYYPNSVVTKEGAKFTLNEGKLGGAEFPIASLNGFSMNWLPQSDTMYIQTKQEPLQVYKEQIAFKGIAKLTPTGMHASGAVDNSAASITAPNLDFKQRSFSGSHAQLLANSDIKGLPAVKADGVAFTYDLNTGSVDFGIEQQGMASIEFPKAQYKTSMSSARWDVNAKKVSLNADENGAKNWFFSQHPEQDSLKFMAASGEYDLAKNTLLAGGVPYIAVADSYVMPDSGKVAVAADATIQTLHNARVVSDSLQQYHKLYAGNINILSRKKFTGDALHNYFNAAADSAAILFSSFENGDQLKKKKKASAYTLATGTIDESKPFYIFPRILYRGKVAMHANKQHMDFDGDLKLNFTDNPADSDWFPYKQDTLNPDEVKIPIINPKAADGTPLHTGLHIVAGSSEVYTTFVSKKQAEDDLDMFVVDGLLSYDKGLGEFKLGREDRAYADSYEGSVLMYNDSSRTIRFGGKLNLVRSTRDFTVQAAGNGNASIDSAQYELDTFLALDTKVPSKALRSMAKNIRANAGGAPEAIDGSSAMLYKLGEFIGNRNVRSYIERSAAEYVPLPKVSKALARNLLLNKVDLRWSDMYNTWYSVGKISLASIDKEDLNVQLDGFMDLRTDLAGDPVMHLYLQADAYTWYYISFFENAYTVASSDDDFNQAVSRAKGVYAGGPIDKNEFILQFRNNYLKGEEAFKVATEQPIADPDAGYNFVEEEEPQKSRKKRKKNKEEDPFGTDAGGSLYNQ